MISISVLSLIYDTSSLKPSLLGGTISISTSRTQVMNLIFSPSLVCERWAAFKVDVYILELLDVSGEIRSN